MRRARIQIKPNIAKAAKQAPAPKVEAPSEPPTPQNEPVVVNQLDSPSESANPLELHVDVKPTVGNTPSNHHVHFGEDVIDNEQSTPATPLSIVQPGLMSPAFAVPNPPSRMMTPRSRNVSMCEDEAILQPKQHRERKRFTGTEKLDTKTWKMSDLTRWNPRNENTSFKRERRSSTSSTLITKSECGEIGEIPPSPRINAPQVKIGADGKLVIDETSLLVQSAQINHESVWETVEEGRMGSKISSMSFRNRIFRKPNLWTEKETDLFYEVLRCTGQDFGLMHHYLPQRSRPELKSKYNREEKQNWARVYHAISNPIRLDKELDTRIERYMMEMEEEAREKKERHEYEKAEEKKVRAALRENQLQERQEERKRKEEAREMLRQARELARDAMIVAKTTEKAEKMKERTDAKQILIEAKRVATEARILIIETRKQEKEQRKLEKEARKKDDWRYRDEQYLEREAERIIRRLIKESQREERRALREKQEAEKLKKNTPGTSSSSTSSAPKKVAEEVVDPYESGAELGDTTSDSSTSASSSDEEALRREAARRETARMKEDRRSMEPRKTVVEKKKVYFDSTVSDVKYANQPTSRAIEMAKAANGNLFSGTDEQDTFEPPAELPEEEPSTAPPPVVEQQEVVKEKEKEPEKEKADKEGSGEEKKNTEESEAAEKPSEEEPMEVEEPVPKAVTDVIEDIVRERSKTPMEARTSEVEKKKAAPNRKKKPVEKKTTPTPIKQKEKAPEPTVVEETEKEKIVPAAKQLKRKEPVVNKRKDKKPVKVEQEKAQEETEKETEATGEPAIKQARIDEEALMMTVAETVEIETSVDDDVISQEPSTSSAPPKRAAPRRTVKKPLTYQKRKS